MMNGMHDGFGMGWGIGWGWIIGLAILAIIVWSIVKGINQRNNPKSKK